MSRSNGITEIPLSRGYYAIVDSADAKLLLPFTWTYSQPPKSKTGYAFTTINGKYTSMHQMLTQAPKRMRTDHKNGNGLDNRRSNLRVCTHAQNMANQGKHNNGLLSRYKGVTRDKAGWMGQLQCGARRFKKRCPTEKEAAEFYNQTAQEVFGEFARLNIIEGD